MELSHIPQDDLMDVMEIAIKIEEYVFDMIEDIPRNISMSALMSASINCMLMQCKTLPDVLFYRNIFTQILDEAIACIDIKREDRPL